MIASSAVGATNSIENNLHHIDGDQQSLHSVYQRRLLLQQLNESCYDVNCVQDNDRNHLQVIEETSFVRRLSRKISSSLLNAMKKFQTPSVIVIIIISYVRVCVCVCFL